MTDICFTGGKLNGITVHFSPELNTLIGIRGSGKSSVLETIRYALGIDTSTVDGSYKKDLVKSVLGSGGQISLQLVDKFGKKYEVRRIYGEQPSVLDDAGNDLAISVRSIINTPLYFGQKDLSFTQAGYELDLLQKLVGGKSSEIGVDMHTYEVDLVDKIRKLSDVSAIPSQIKELEEKNADLKHKLKVFEEKGVAIKLKKQTSCNSDITRLQGISTKFENLISELRKALMVATREDFELNTYVSEFNPETFKKADQIIQNALTQIKNIESAIEVLEMEKSSLITAKKGLSDKADSLKEEFAVIKREIQDEIDKIKTSQNELRIEIAFKGNKSVFKESLRNNFRGTAISDGKYQQICDEFSDFVAILEDYYINGGCTLKSILTDGEYAKLGEKIEENYEKLVAIECPNLVRIYYHGKLLEQHSIGQRASALILFILTQKDNDIIIIDQPEDDLDNQVIYRKLSTQ